MITIPVDGGVRVISVWGVVAICLLVIGLLGVIVLLVALVAGKRQR
jgi:hypothetical protein